MANELVTTSVDSVIVEERLFELAQRKAQIYAKSSLVPAEYRNNVGNVLIAENMARRLGADTLLVMQNLHVVHGRPGWSSQFLIACFNSCGRFDAIKYRFTGEKGTPSYGCVAWTREIVGKAVIEGTEITIDMASKEGWLGKNGSKWKTMPEQMLRYRAASFLVRTTAPEISMGFLTKEELEDIGPPAATNGKASLEDLTNRLNGVVEDTAADIVQAVVVEDECETVDGELFASERPTAAEL